MKLSAPTVLVICEGFGYTTETHNNALAQAETPFLDALCENYPTTLLKAHGNALGYPDYYGSSPFAGFWTLLSGEKNNTQLAQLESAIQSGTFFEHKTLEKVLSPLAKHTNRFHIIVTLSHTSCERRIEHMLALIHTALFYEVKEVMIHIVLTDHNTFDMKTFTLLEKLEAIVVSVPQVTIASIQGSSYTSPHTATSTTVEQSYTVLTQQCEVPFSSWKDVLSHYYVLGIHDNAIPPTALCPESHIHSKDGLIFATYHPHECQALKERMEKTNIPIRPLLSLFDEPHKKTTALYHQKNFKDSLAHAITSKHISSLAIVDYHHKNDLYFYAQDHFKDFTQELTIRSVLQGSHITHAHTNAITEAFFEALSFEHHTFYILNYSAAAQYAFNHNLPSTIEAIENIDTQLGYLYHKVVEQRKGNLFITSSYPLLENIQTSHLHATFLENTNPVFFIAVDANHALNQTQLPLLELTDVTPFVLRHITALSQSHK